jgi:hypothetical protein
LSPPQRPIFKKEKYLSFKPKSGIREKACLSHGIGYSQL